MKKGCAMISGVRGEGFGGEEPVDLELMRTFFIEEPFQHNGCAIRDSSSIHAQAPRLSMAIFKFERKLVGASPRRCPTGAVSGTKHVTSMLQSLLPFDPPGFETANVSQFFSGTIAKEFSLYLKCHAVCGYSEEWGLGSTTRKLVFTVESYQRVDGIT
jgi:hypothetical protein